MSVGSGTGLRLRSNLALMTGQSIFSAVKDDASLSLRRKSCLSFPPLTFGELPSPTSTPCWPTSTCCCKAPISPTWPLTPQLTQIPVSTMPPLQSNDNCSPGSNAKNVSWFTSWLYGSLDTVSLVAPPTASLPASSLLIAMTSQSLITTLLDRQQQKVWQREARMILQSFKWIRNLYDCWKSGKTDILFPLESC